VCRFPCSGSAGAALAEAAQGVAPTAANVDPSARFEQVQGSAMNGSVILPVVVKADQAGSTPDQWTELRAAAGGWGWPEAPPGSEARPAVAERGSERSAERAQ